MIVHTSAVILKTIDYSESSKIVTLLSRRHGKIPVIVKGAKRPKSKFAGLLEVGSLLDVVYYYKSSRSVQTLSEADYLRKTMNLRLDFEKMAVAMSALELIGQLLHENEVNRPVFDFIKKFLIWLDGTEAPPAHVFPYLQIRLAGLIGFALQIDPKLSRSSSMETYLNIDSGLISGEDTASHSYRLSDHQYAYLSMAIQSHNSAVFSLSFTEGELRQLVNYLDRYFKFHVESMKPRKSDAIFQQILNPRS